MFRLSWAFRTWILPRRGQDSSNSREHGPKRACLSDDVLMAQHAPEGVDTATPNVARIYDYLLGGKDNFAADRAAAQHLLAAIPDVAAIAQDNRAFLQRVVRHLVTEEGITQFLDLGSGLPTRSNVHEVAPHAQVAYVDYDPVVVRHGQALLASGSRVAMVQADLTEPAAVLKHPDVRRVLDLSRPLALLCLGALHFVPYDADPYAITAGYRDRIAPGSFLAITHAPKPVPGEDLSDDGDSATDVFSRASAHLFLRSHAEILRFFDGFAMVDPGLTWVSQWRPEPGRIPVGRLRSLHAGVGRKPLGLSLQV